jgi:hypothetical protein
MLHTERGHAYNAGMCLCVYAWQDDLAGMFQSAGNLVFDLSNSDNVNMAIAQSKCQKVSYLSIGAEALSVARNPLT